MHVDMGRVRSTDPWRPYLEEIERVPFVRRARLVEVPAKGSDPGFDARLTLTTADRSDVVLPVELKRTHLTTAMARQLATQTKRHPGLVVMAPAIGRELGELLVESRTNYVDLAGNCYLRVGDRYVANVQGKRAEKRASVDKILRAPAYRVLFALLADPKLAGAPVRAIAEAAGGVSPQTASDVRSRLVANGTLLQTRAGLVWAPQQRRQVIDMFLLGFGALVASFSIGRYRARGPTPAEHEAALRPHLARLGEWRWGGGAGAQRLTGFYRGDQTIVYLAGTPDAAALRRLPLVPDRDGNVLLARAPGPLAFSGPSTEVVHPLLVYADLLSENNERAREAAAQIRDQFLEDDGA